MIKVYTSSVIDAPADAVWAQVRDFNGLPRWTPFVADYPLTGDQVHDAFLSATAATLRPLVSRREATYRLNLLERHGPG